MKMTRSDPETDMEMDMTPMIDIVFQLIIFFMLISDMSQKTLEDLVLPDAESADPDKPDPLDIRPVINLLASGAIYVDGEQKYDPDDPDDYRAVRQYLVNQAKRMEREPLDENQPDGKTVPADALLVRADQSTPFHHVQKVMELCGLEGIQIWKIQLAASEVAPEDGVPAPQE